MSLDIYIHIHMWIKIHLNPEDQSGLSHSSNSDSWQERILIHQTHYPFTSVEEIWQERGVAESPNDAMLWRAGPARHLVFAGWTSHTWLSNQPVLLPKDLNEQWTRPDNSRPSWLRRYDDVVHINNQLFLTHSDDVGEHWVDKGRMAPWVTHSGERNEWWTVWIEH